jgi:hypothetical protein
MVLEVPVTQESETDRLCPGPDCVRACFMLESSTQGTPGSPTVKTSLSFEPIRALCSLSRLRFGVPVPIPAPLPLPFSIAAPLPVLAPAAAPGMVLLSVSVDGRPPDSLPAIDPEFYKWRGQCMLYVGIYQLLFTHGPQAAPSCRGLQGH